MATRKTPRRDPAPLPAAASPPARYEIRGDRPKRVAEPGSAYVGATPTLVSATEAARSFSDLINRACFQEEVFVIERGGRAICQLGPLQGRPCTGADLLALLSRLPRPDEEYLAAVETLSRTQPVVEASPWEE